MPQFGTLDITKRAAGLPEATRLANEPWEAEGVEVVNFMYELDNRDDLAMIPKAVHPAIPFYGNLMLRAYPTSPVGPFKQAEFRIMTRAGIHYGGFVTGAYVDSQAACAFLREAYGLPAALGKISIDHRHYGTEGRVEADGRVVFDGTLEHPEPISSTDLMYTESFHLALCDGQPTLVQVEPSYGPETAERGTPRVRVFEGEAFGDARLKLTNPLPATYIRGKVGLDKVRYLMDPDVPAMQGTRRREP